MNSKILNQLNTEVKLLSYFMFSEEGKIVVPMEKTSLFTGRSVISLKRDKAEGVGIPTCQLGKESGSDKTYYSVVDIASFIVARKKKVMS